MKFAFWLVLTLFFMFASLMLGMYWGQGQAYTQVFKLYAVDMRIAQEKNNVVLAELSKARYYYYANQSQVRLTRGEGDYGPVNEELLKGFSAGKGPTTFKEEYADYRKIPGFAE